MLAPDYSFYYSSNGIISVVLTKWSSVKPSNPARGCRMLPDRRRAVSIGWNRRCGAGDRYRKTETWSRASYRIISSRGIGFLVICTRAIWSWAGIRAFWAYCGSMERWAAWTSSTGRSGTTFEFGIMWILKMWLLRVWFNHLDDQYHPAGASAGLRRMGL